ncbi:hypothetical protein I547_3752 [Mycobacterium kansasii 824]|uniref:Uncharacterized protein n=1 Tax=Mycobacterium kansasii TaxID=1768 RepID=A0A1V3XNT4_MYCKA|nr:hypothetical protein I547_3752 [Mycobacterium kansasii 824]OOK78821.1 hypothetical protein BZL30_2392 [Mycobacterium kansasii]OOK80865.1 hypothetical protein BZL29_2369 [Mycobacterium kansasii]
MSRTSPQRVLQLLLATARLAQLWGCCLPSADSGPLIGEAFGY